MRLIAEDISGERSGQTVFSGVDFALGDGAAIVVTGPNGAGKSTLLRIVAGLLPLAAGTVTLEADREIWPTVASAAHYLGHLNGMKPALTVQENLSFWRDFLGGDGDVADALLRVDLEEIAHLPFGYLSTGQRRRVAIARLLVARRPIWMLDEPTAGLDAASERRFADLMTSHLADGGMILAATHLPLGISNAVELRMAG